eukprot:1604851-Amphidinium_carterae.1
MKESKTKRTATAERGHLPTLRFQQKGSRRVIITRESSLLTYLRAKRPGELFGFVQAWQNFRAMTSETLQNYVAQHGKDSVWHAT